MKHGQSYGVAGWVACLSLLCAGALVPRPGAAQSCGTSFEYTEVIQNYCYDRSNQSQPITYVYRKILRCDGTEPPNPYCIVSSSTVPECGGTSNGTCDQFGLPRGCGTGCGDDDDEYCNGRDDDGDGSVDDGCGGGGGAGGGGGGGGTEGGGVGSGLGGGGDDAPSGPCNGEDCACGSSYGDPVFAGSGHMRLDPVEVVHVDGPWRVPLEFELHFSSRNQWSEYLHNAGGASSDSRLALQAAKWNAS